MMRKPSESAVDRLIALASDEKPAVPEPAPEPAPAPVEAAPSEPEPEAPSDLETVPGSSNDQAQQLEENPMWKALVQFRGLIPYVTRLLELSAQGDQAPLLANELKQSMGDLQTAQRELRLVSQDQVLQMKRLESELTRSREAVERSTVDTAELVEDVKSVHSLMKVSMGILGGVVVVLVVVLVFLITRMPHR